MSNPFKAYINMRIMWGSHLCNGKDSTMDGCVNIDKIKLISDQPHARNKGW